MYVQKETKGGRDAEKEKKKGERNIHKMREKERVATQGTRHASCSVLKDLNPELNNCAAMCVVYSICPAIDPS